MCQCGSSFLCPLWLTVVNCQWRSRGAAQEQGHITWECVSARLRVCVGPLSSHGHHGGDPRAWLPDPKALVRVPRQYLGAVERDDGPSSIRWVTDTRPSPYTSSCPADICIIPSFVLSFSASTLDSCRAIKLTYVDGDILYFAKILSLKIYVCVCVWTKTPAYGKWGRGSHSPFFMIFLLISMI